MKIPASNSEQRAIEDFHPGRGEPQKLGLPRGGRPAKRAGSLFPVVRHGLLHQPGAKLIGLGRQAEVGLSLLKAGKVAERLSGALRRGGESFGLITGGRAA
jgi:hypothetical protein